MNSKKLLLSLICFMVGLLLLFLVNIILFWTGFAMAPVFKQFQEMLAFTKLGIMLLTIGLELLFIYYLVRPMSDFIYINVIDKIPHTNFISFLIGLAALVNGFINIAWFYDYAVYYDMWVGVELLLMWGFILPLNAVLLPLHKISVWYATA